MLIFQQSVDFALITLFLAGAVYLVIAAVGFRNIGIRDATSRLLSLYALISLGWVAAQALPRMQQLAMVRGFDPAALERIALYLMAGQAVVFFQLTRQFERRREAGLLGWAAGFGLVGLAILLLENPLGLPENLLVAGAATVVRWQAGYVLLLVARGLFMACALVLTIRSLRGQISPLHRNRSTYWLLSVILAVSGQALLLFRLAIPANAIPANLLHMLAVGVAAYAHLTYNLPDLRAASRRSISFVISGAITALAYAGGYLAIQAVARDNPTLPPAAAGAILAFFLLLLFNPLLNIIQRQINRLVNSSQYDARQMLSEYVMRISNILDINRLSATVNRLVSEAMGITRGALLNVELVPGETFWQEDSGAYTLHDSDKPGLALPEGRLAAKNPVVAYLRSEHQPLTQFDIDLLPRFRTMDPDEREWLSRLNMDVYVPIYSKDHWIGLLVLGPKRSGDRYFPEDLALLQTMADQTAFALENARLYENLKQRNAENEQLNTELKTANIELSRLDRAKSDFIHIASHELRTPLTQVIGYNDILGEMIRANDLQPEIGGQMVDSVRKAARRLEEIVETMFDVSKLEAKTLDLALAPVSLSSIISVAIDIWAKGISERCQSISVRGVANLPVITADGKRLTQVFSHLIQNAIKSTPDGGQIRITGQMPAVKDNGDLDSDENYIEIVVADTGIGIAGENLERVFEKFYRVGSVLLHSSGDIKFKGAGPGLGLTIARGIVEAHNGRIWAESPGHDENACPGAKFHVRLPLYTREG